MDSVKRIELPELIPVLPVRNTVLFPNTAVPLVVGRSKSIRTVRHAQKHGDILLVVAQKEGEQESPGSKDLHSIGTVCLISKIHQTDKEGFQLIANGLFRFRIHEYVETDAFLSAKGTQIVEVSSNTAKIETLSQEIKNLGKTILNLAAIPSSESLHKLLNQITDPQHIADLACTFLPLPIQVKQDLLETLDLEMRLEKILDLMATEKEKLIVQSEIQGKMMDRLSKDQREHILREQIKTLHDELGDDTDIAQEYLKKIEAAEMPADARKVADEELSRLRAVQRSSPEYHVIRTYLDALVSLPWSKTSGTESGDIDLKKARAILDEDHFGIEKVKARILEFVAVTKLKNDMKGPILCLAGPPGVGKTSIAESIAKALGRKFIRTSLGGLRDEAEIRGHRRTYIGAMPGRIMQAMKRAGVKDPLILLDEVDKIGMDFRGDPASALLEVLDPEQNHTFTDHYIDIPFDLSRVMFVTTANMLETIPPALRDRLEIIEMTSYSKVEKLQIAQRHLMRKIYSDHGLTENQIQIPSTTIADVIEHYTREAGVRNLTRELAHLCRAAAVELAEDFTKKVVVSPDKLESILGPKKFFSERAEDETKPGVITGLAWTPVGGEILNIEVARMDGRGQLILTGSLGDVMKESAQIALSLVRSKLGKQSMIRFDRSDFHIHVPSGAIPKDGPSAGVALFLALASLIENKAVSAKIAMTGEITLRGNVLPVGGIKEKVIAAHRAGIQTLFLPERNAGDLREVSEEVKKALKIHFVKDVSQALVLAGLDELKLPFPVPSMSPKDPNVPMITN